MSALLSLAKRIDQLSERVGRGVFWLILLMVVISTLNALSRKLFSISSNAYLEVQWYLFAAVFLLNAGNVLLKNAHVRIDVLTVHLRARVRLWIDLFGTLFFLMPFVVLMLYFSWPYFLTSFSQNEWSTNSGGLLVWPAKLLIVVGFALLLLQAIAQAIKLVAALMGRISPDAALPPAVHNELGEAPANGATESKQY